MTECVLCVEKNNDRYKIYIKMNFGKQVVANIMIDDRAIINNSRIITNSGAYHLKRLANFLCEHGADKIFYMSTKDFVNNGIFFIQKEKNTYNAIIKDNIDIPICMLNEFVESFSREIMSIH